MTKEFERAKPAKKKRLARYHIDRFILSAACQIEPMAFLLDAGAGNCKHKSFFPRARYVGLDLSPPRKRRYGEIEIGGNLYNLPFRENSFDASLNVEVLEHLKEPKEALREIFRVLKPGGKLFLIAPQAWEEHGVPEDYWRFTSFGLRYLFAAAGFEVSSIEPLGGYFAYIGQFISVSYRYLFPTERRLFLKILDAPFRHPARLLLRTLIPQLCFYLDRLDKRRSFTLNYGCICTKPLR